MIASSSLPALTDERSLDVLDFDAVRSRVARQAMTDRAAAFARTMMPSNDVEAARREQEATREMRAIVLADSFSLPRVTEVGESVARAQRGAALPAEELHSIGIALAAADAAVRRVRSSEAPLLIERCSGASSLAAVIKRVDEAIGERGEVLDRASPALARIRRSAVRALDEARERCQAMLRSATFARAVQDAIVTMREGRFVIPIKAEFAGQVPGVVHDTSASGHTLFVEPLAALEVNNRLRTLRIEEEREVARILAELSALVGAHATQAEMNLAVLAEIDLVLARARVAHEMDAIAPTMLDVPHVDIRAGRHPLLGTRAVPQSFALGDEVRFIVISGPNMGGKTVSLKMLGLFVAMAYCGLQLPAAEGTSIGAFDYLGCDIGDEQSIAENSSTFSAHVVRLRALLERAGPRTLVLVDEIASGTEPAAGAALAVAILERFLAAGARGVVTTHATELKLFAHATPGFANASVRFDPQTYAPTFELDLGAPGQSLAFALSRSLGIDGAIVARAESLLSASERDYDRALAELATIRAQAAAEREAAGQERAHLGALQENARRRADALERERRDLGRRAEERLSQALREFATELERRAKDQPVRARVTSGQSALLSRTLDDVHAALGLRPQPHASAAAPAVAVGDVVIVHSLGSEGTIADDYGDTVLVAIGPMKTVVPKRDVAVVRSVAMGEANRPRARAKTGATLLETASAARDELDVRGKRFVEAEPIVDKWIDDAELLGLSPLRLIHGKGTGLLGRGLQQYLRERRGVRSVRFGRAEEGGSGVTVVELE